MSANLSLAAAAFLTLQACGSSSLILRPLPDGEIRSIGSLAVVSIIERAEIDEEGLQDEEIEIAEGSSYEGIFWEDLLSELAYTSSVSRIERETLVNVDDFQQVRLGIPNQTNRRGRRQTKYRVFTMPPDSSQVYFENGEYDYVLFVEELEIGRTRPGRIPVIDPGFPSVPPRGPNARSQRTVEATDGISFSTRMILWDNDAGIPVWAGIPTGYAEAEKRDGIRGVLGGEQPVTRATWILAIRDLVTNVVEGAQLPTR